MCPQMIFPYPQSTLSNRIFKPPSGDISQSSPKCAWTFPNFILSIIQMMCIKVTVKSSLWPPNTKVSLVCITVLGKEKSSNRGEKVKKYIYSMLTRRELMCLCIHHHPCHLPPHCSRYTFDLWRKYFPMVIKV